MVQVIYMRTVEKREVPRVPVSMTVEKDLGDKIVFGYARDISKHGMAVNAEIMDEARDLPMIGDTFLIKFKLPSSITIITAIGKVVRMDLYDNKPPILGLEFQNLTAEYGDIIDDFVKRILRL